MKIATIQVVGAPDEGSQVIAHMIQTALAQYNIDAWITGIPEGEALLQEQEWTTVAAGMGESHARTTINIIQSPTA